MSWREEFINRISKFVINPEEANKAWILKQNNLPQSLFRYRPLSQYVADEIKNDTVWLSSPNEFNDPLPQNIYCP